MSGWIKNLLSYLVLLSILATYIPFADLHGHTTTPCDATNVEQEQNLCHIEIYHSDASSVSQCEHKSHILDEHQHCSLCKFILEKKQKNVKTINSFSGYNLSYLLKNDSFIYKEALFFDFPRYFFFERGPPA